jgi:hypothetical protein
MVFDPTVVMVGDPVVPLTVALALPPPKGSAHQTAAALS